MINKFYFSSDNRTTLLTIFQIRIFHHYADSNIIYQDSCSSKIDDLAYVPMCVGIGTYAL